jgi:dephospho-CoA kinase
MLKVGLTGSIAVGKSFVTSVLAELGCFVLDADRTAREVVEPQTVGWHRIVESFGKGVLNSDETLNRAKLGEIVFSDEPKRNLLNQIVHPLVFAAQNEWMEKVAAENERSIAVIDAALMIESGGYRRFDKIIVVWCEPETQIERLMARNSINREEAMRRIGAQMPQAEKKKYADFLINTTNGFDDTRAQTESVYESLAKLNN